MDFKFADLVPSVHRLRERADQADRLEKIIDALKADLDEANVRAATAEGRLRELELMMRQAAEALTAGGVRLVSDSEAGGEGEA